MARKSSSPTASLSRPRHSQVLRQRRARPAAARLPGWNIRPALLPGRKRPVSGSRSLPSVSIGANDGTPLVLGGEAVCMTTSQGKGKAECTARGKQREVQCFHFDNNFLRGAPMTPQQPSDAILPDPALLPPGPSPADPPVAVLPDTPPAPVATPASMTVRREGIYLGPGGPRLDTAQTPAQTP